MDVLIENGLLVTVNKEREILEHHSIAVQGNRIAEIGPAEMIASKFKDVRKKIDAAGKIVFPGLINTHTHLFQTLLKGLGDDMALADWLATMTFPSAAHLTPEYVYAAAMLGCVEGIRSGTTTVLDYMYPHSMQGLSDGVIEAFRTLKIRGILGRGMMNTGEEFGVDPRIMQDSRTIEKDVLRLVRKYHATENGRVSVWLAPAAIWSITGDLLKLTWSIACEYGTGFTVHISETPFDRAASEKLHGLPDVEVLGKLNILGPAVLMVHCVHLTGKDIDMARANDLKVSHNPVSNMYLSSGIAPVTQMLGKGITVGLGTDGAASNNSQDMIEVMKTTALLHKVATMNPVAISAETVLEMATIDGAKAIGMEDEIGSLEAGKKADFFIYDPSRSAKSTPVFNPVSALVYTGSQMNVETVVIDGNIVMEDGKLLSADEEMVIKDGQKTADDLAQKSGSIKNKYRSWKWR